jgi:hypothetical protein
MTPRMTPWVSFVTPALTCDVTPYDTLYNTQQPSYDTYLSLPTKWERVVVGSRRNV